MNVNFEEQVYNVDESHGAALVSVVLSHPLKRGITFTVKVGTKDISATQSGDYKIYIMCCDGLHVLQIKIINLDHTL